MEDTQKDVKPSGYRLAVEIGKAYLNQFQIEANIRDHIKTLVVLDRATWNRNGLINQRALAVARKKREAAVAALRKHMGL